MVPKYVFHLKWQLICAHCSCLQVSAFHDSKTSALLQAKLIWITEIIVIYPFRQLLSTVQQLKKFPIFDYHSSQSCTADWLLHKWCVLHEGSHCMEKRDHSREFDQPKLIAKCPPWGQSNGPSQNVSFCFIADSIWIYHDSVCEYINSWTECLIHTKRV